MLKIERGTLEREDDNGCNVGNTYKKVRITKRREISEDERAENFYRYKRIKCLRSN